MSTERYAKWGKGLLAGGAIATALTLSLGVRDCRQRVSDGKEFQQAGQEMLMRYAAPIGVSYFTWVCGVMLYMSRKGKSSGAQPSYNEKGEYVRVNKGA